MSFQLNKISFTLKSLVLNQTTNRLINKANPLKWQKQFSFFDGNISNHIGIYRIYSVPDNFISIFTSLQRNNTFKRNLNCE